MGFFNKIKQFVSEEALGDETINTIESSYMIAQRQQPHEEPHAWLASAWLHRIKASGRSIDDESAHLIAFNETFLHACVKPPLCARSLGLFFSTKKTHA